MSKGAYQVSWWTKEQNVTDSVSDAVKCYIVSDDSKYRLTFSTKTDEGALQNTLALLATAYNAGRDEMAEELRHLLGAAKR